MNKFLKQVFTLFLLGLILTFIACEEEEVLNENQNIENQDVEISDKTLRKDETLRWLPFIENEYGEAITSTYTGVPFYLRVDTTLCNCEDWITSRVNVFLTSIDENGYQDVYTIARNIVSPFVPQTSRYKIILPLNISLGNYVIKITPGSINLPDGIDGTEFSYSGIFSVIPHADEIINLGYNGGVFQDINWNTVFFNEYVHLKVYLDGQYIETLIVENTGGYRVWGSQYDGLVKINIYNPENPEINAETETFSIYND